MTEKIDYSLKSRAISQGWHRVEKTLSKNKYTALKELDKFIDIRDDEAYEKVEEQYYEAVENYNTMLNNPMFVEAIKINKASYKRKSRLSKRIAKILKCGNAYFLTLTFNDETLESTSDVTRRRYVTRFLKANCVDYVANKDFGAENGREHYHAVVTSSTLSMSSWDKYGFSNAKPIRSEADDCVLAKYLCKLTNHAIKETCKRSALIYSNNKKDS